MRILVVEDLTIMRRVLINTLKTIGFDSFLEASNGNEALEKIINEEVDFVITDWNMPMMDGLEMLKSIRTRQQTKDLPVLMVTTRSDKSDVVDAMQNKIDGYIVKPFTTEVVKRKIEEISLRHDFCLPNKDFIIPGPVM